MGKWEGERGKEGCAGVYMVFIINWGIGRKVGEIGSEVSGYE